MQLLPKTTASHEYILYLLYKFRFLHTTHFQKLFHHKDPHRIKAWLTYLRMNGFIYMQYNPKSFVDRTKPAIYYLAPKARYILQSNKQVDMAVFERIYKEKKRTKSFIEHCLTVADIYLFLASQYTTKDKVHFFPESELARFDYFPDPRPTAYIAVKTYKGTQRYFLEVFYDYASTKVYRGIVQKYIRYAESKIWEGNTDSQPQPKVLFVCSTPNNSSHTYFYTKSFFAKAGENIFPLFLTTKDRLLLGKDTPLWEKVTIE